MAICPKCGANAGFAKVCPACGEPMVKQAIQSAASDIERLKDVTSDFSKKPACSDEELKALAVRIMTNASVGEKAQYEGRIKAYLDNYKNGGSSIVNAPLKSEYARSGEAATQGGAVAASSKPSRSRGFGGMNKKPIIIAVAAVLGVGVLVGGTIGIVSAIKNSNDKSNQSNSTYVYLYYNYPNSYSSNYIYKEFKLNEYNGISSYEIPSYEGYTFKGFYSSSYGGSQFINEYGEGTREWYGSYEYLYAHWEENATNTVFYGKKLSGTTYGPAALTTSSSVSLSLSSDGSYTGQGLNGRSSGSYSTSSSSDYYISYGAKDLYLDYSPAFMTSDENFVWMPYNKSNTSFGNSTYIMVNEALNSAYSIKYLRYGNLSSSWYNPEYLDTGCDVILVEYKAKSYSSAKYYLFANNKIYEEVTWYSSSTYEFSNLSRSSSIEIYVSGDLLLEK